jgi:hypothetical protein
MNPVPFLTEDEVNDGLTVVRQLNPCEALVTWRGPEVRLAVKPSARSQGVNVLFRPQWHHHFVIRTDGRELYSALFELGVRSIGRNSAAPARVFELAQAVFHVKYARAGERTEPLTEEALEAVPGVLKCIKTSLFCSPDAWVYDPVEDSLRREDRHVEEDS